MKILMTLRQKVSGSPLSSAWMPTHPGSIARYLCRAAFFSGAVAGALTLGGCATQPMPSYNPLSPIQVREVKGVMGSKNYFLCRDCMAYSHFEPSHKTDKTQVKQHKTRGVIQS